jgi:hypothetical protein
MMMALGPLIPKKNGDTFGGVVEFDHKGAGGDFDVGFGVAYSPTPTWAYKTVTLPDDASWMHYQVSVSGIFNTTEAPGTRIGTMKFIQYKGGPRDISGKGMLLADPDADVYVVSKPEFSNLQATYS